MTSIAGFQGSIIPLSVWQTPIIYKIYQSDGSVSPLDLASEQERRATAKVHQCAFSTQNDLRNFLLTLNVCHVVPFQAFSYFLNASATRWAAADADRKQPSKLDSENRSPASTSGGSTRSPSPTLSAAAAAVSGTLT